MKETTGIPTLPLLVLFVTLVFNDHFAIATTRYIPSAVASPLSSPELSPSFIMTALLHSSERGSYATQNNDLPSSPDERRHKLSETLHLSSFSGAMSSQMSSLSSAASSESASPEPLPTPPSMWSSEIEEPSKPSKKQKSKSVYKALHKDLMRLSSLLPGVYTNTQQYRQEGGKELPMDKRHVLLRSAYKAIRLGFLPSAFAVLVQDYSNDSLFPFRQRVHTFSVDLPHRAIRMKVWNFATNRTEKKATHNLDFFRKLRRKDLISQGACDMFWRRLNKKTFVGITGKECLGYVHGEKVRITVSTTLTSHLLQTNEGWYRARDGKKLVEIDVPYNLVRTKSFEDHRVKPQRSEMAQRPRHRQTTQNDVPTQPSPVDKITSSHQRHDEEKDSDITGDSSNDYDDDDDDEEDEDSDDEDVKTPTYNNNLQEKTHSAKEGNDKNDEEEEEEREDKHGKPSKDAKYVLADFKSIVKALHSGQTVFYFVELSACSLPSQHKVERMSFGDFVDSFESFFGGASKDKATVRFWQTKYVQGNEGIEELTREIIVKDNGRVTVHIHRKQPGSDKVTWDHVAQCKLFDPETGLGGVKLTTKPLENVRELSTFGRLRSSLRRGRRQVRMLLDLNQCDGRTQGVKAIIGFTIRAYDLINQGKAIEVTQLTPEAESSHRKLLTGHFLRNGEVIFITSFLPGNEMHDFQHVQLLHQDATYRCALSGSDISRNKGPWGVRLFYTT